MKRKLEKIKGNMLRSRFGFIGYGKIGKQIRSLIRPLDVK